MASHAITWHRQRRPKSEVDEWQGNRDHGNRHACGLSRPSADHEFQSGTANITLVGRCLYLLGRLNNCPHPATSGESPPDADAIKFATVLDPWKTGATVKITPSSATTTIEVSGTGYDDTWTWNDPKDADDAVDPSTASGAGAASDFADRSRQGAQKVGLLKFCAPEAPVPSGRRGS